MRQVAILALIILAVSAADVAKLNCTSLADPAYNFYKPPADCVSNDTAVKLCISTYDACVATASGACTASLGTCLPAKLRCLENVAPSTAQCASWVTMFSNEKLYITAGGDYNGSTLELSCRAAICGFQKANPNSACTAEQEKGVCFDALVPSTIPPPGRPVVSFTIGGDKDKFAAWIAKGKDTVFPVLRRLLATMLGTTADQIVIIDAKVGSIVIDFYTVDNNLDVASVTTKLEAAKANTNAGTDYFSELATETGIDASTITVAEFNVVEATPTPAPGSTPVPGTPVPGTPTPGTAAPGDSTPAPPLTPAAASTVATALAVVAVVAAMLF